MRRRARAKRGLVLRDEEAEGTEIEEAEGTEIEEAEGTETEEAEVTEGTGQHGATE